MVVSRPDHVFQPTLPTAGAGGVRTIRPIGVYQLYGLAFVQQPICLGIAPGNEGQADLYGLLALDPIRGYLLQVEPANDNTLILNPYQVNHFVDATGLALEAAAPTLWFCRENSVYFCSLFDFNPSTLSGCPTQPMV